MSPSSLSSVQTTRTMQIVLVFLLQSLAQRSSEALPDIIKIGEFDFSFLFSHVGRGKISLDARFEYPHVTMEIFLQKVATSLSMAIPLSQLGIGSRLRYLFSLWRIRAKSAGFTTSLSHSSLPPHSLSHIFTRIFRRYLLERAGKKYLENLCGPKKKPLCCLKKNIMRGVFLRFLMLSFR